MLSRGILQQIEMVFQFILKLDSCLNLLKIRRHIDRAHRATRTGARSTTGSCRRGSNCFAHRTVTRSQDWRHSYYMQPGGSRLATNQNFLSLHGQPNDGKPRCARTPPSSCPTQSVTTRDAIPILIEFGLVCQVVIEVCAWLKLVGREMLLQFKAKL